MEHITISVADIEVEHDEDSGVFVLGQDTSGRHSIDLEKVKATLRRENHTAVTVSVTQFLCTMASVVPGVNLLQPIMHFVNTEQSRTFSLLSSLSLHLLSTSELSALFSTDINTTNPFSSQGSTLPGAENISDALTPSPPSARFTLPLIALYSLCNVSCVCILLVSVVTALCYVAYPLDPTLFALAMLLATAYVCLLIEHVVSTRALMDTFIASVRIPTASVLRGGIIRKHTPHYALVAGDLIYLSKGAVTPSPCLILHSSPTFSARSVSRVLSEGLRIESGHCLALLLLPPPHVYTARTSFSSWRDVHRATLLLLSVFVGVLLLFLTQIQSISVYQALPYILTALLLRSVCLSAATIKCMASTRSYITGRGMYLLSSGATTPHHSLLDLSLASSDIAATSLLTCPSSLSHSPIISDCDITTAEDTAAGVATASNAGWRVMRVIGPDGLIVRSIRSSAGAAAILQALSTCTAAENTVDIYDIAPPPPPQLLECIAHTLPLHLIEDVILTPVEQQTQAALPTQSRGRRRRSFFSQPQAEISIVGDNIETALYEYVLGHSSQIVLNPFGHQHGSGETIQPRLAQHRSIYSSITLNSAATALSAACATDVEASVPVLPTAIEHAQHLAAVRSIGQFRDTHMPLQHWYSADGVEMVLYATLFGVVGAVIAGDLQAVLRRCNEGTPGAAAVTLSSSSNQTDSRHMAYAHIILVEEGYAVDGYENRLQTATTALQQLFQSGAVLPEMRFAGSVTLIPPRMDTQLLNLSQYTNVSAAIVSSQVVVHGLPRKIKASSLCGDAITRQRIRSHFEKLGDVPFFARHSSGDPILLLGANRRAMAESILPSLSSDSSGLCMVIIDIDPIDETSGIADNALLLDAATAMVYKRLQDCQASIVPIALCDETSSLPDDVASVASICLSHMSQLEELLHICAHYRDALTRLAHSSIPIVALLVLTIFMWAFGGLPLALHPLHMIVASLVIQLPQVGIVSCDHKDRLPSQSRDISSLATALAAALLGGIAAATAYVLTFAKHNISISELRNSLHRHFNASPHLNQDFSCANGDVLSPRDQIAVLREVQTSVLAVALLCSIINCYLMKESRVSIFNLRSWTNKCANQAAFTLLIVVTLICYSIPLVQYALLTEAPSLIIVLKLVFGYAVVMLVGTEARKRYVCKYLCHEIL